jgi:hypothetical protein
MTTVTANDVRALARSGDEDPVLAVIDGEIVVIPEAELEENDRVLCTQEALVRELGAEVTEVEAELFAGRLSGLLTE